MSILPDTSGLASGFTDYLDTEAGLKETSKVVLPPIENVVGNLESDKSGLVGDIGDVIDDTASAVNNIAVNVTQTLKQVEQGLTEQYHDIPDSTAANVIKPVAANTPAVVNFQTGAVAAKDDASLFEEQTLTIPEKFQESLVKALDSGDWNITKLLLDKISSECPNQAIGDSILKDDMTPLEYCGIAGNTSLYDSLVEARYAPADADRRKNAHQKLIHAATISKEDQEDASTQQLLTLIFFVGLLKDKHALTGRYYKVRHMWLFFLPGAVLSAIAALLSFLSTSALTSNISSILALIVGSLSSFSALIQTINDQLGYSSITVQHESAAHELDGILQSLTFSFVDAMSGGKLPITEHELKTIKKQVGSIELTCKTPVPQHLHSFYDSMLSELYMYRKSAKPQMSDEVMIEIQEDSIHDLEVITHTIVNSMFWPWTFSPTKVRLQVMTALRDQIGCVSGGDDSQSLFQAMKNYDRLDKPQYLSKKTLSHMPQPNAHELA